MVLTCKLLVALPMIITLFKSMIRSNYRVKIRWKDFTTWYVNKYSIKSIDFCLDFSKQSPPITLILNVECQVLNVGICSYIDYCTGTIVDKKTSLSLSIKHLKFRIIGKCPGDGIGRHARLKIWWPQGRGGSSPPLGKKMKSEENQIFFIIYNKLPSKVSLYHTSAFVPKHLTQIFYLE